MDIAKWVCVMHYLMGFHMYLIYTMVLLIV